MKSNADRPLTYVRWGLITFISLNSIAVVMNHKVLLFAAYQKMNRKYHILFFVLQECVQFHLIEYQDNAEYILLIYFSISDLISV